MVGDLWRSIRDAFEQFRSRKESMKQRRERRRNSLFAELLERRELLSVNQILYDAANSRLYLVGTSDADQVSVSYSAGSLVARAESVDGIVEQSFSVSAVSSIRFDGGNGNDTFVNGTNVPVLAFGGAGNDYLSGGNADDELNGGDGDDELVGNGGDDALLGDAGNDTLSGGLGNDNLYGGSGNDSLDGGDGADKLQGESGDDNLQGGSGNDSLYGYDGNDVLDGGDGNDYLDGMDGDDRLLGSAGDDVLIGGAGIDTLLGGLGNDDLYGGSGNDSLDGGDGADRLRGDSGDDNLQGGSGDDFLYGYDGNDTLDGGDGNDLLQGMDGDDWLLGNAGDDVLLGDAGNDTLSGGLGNDNLYGGSGNDSLDGGDGADKLQGESGDDNLQGGSGNDSLYGYDGNDVLDGGDGNDYLDGMDGDDRLLGSAGDDVLIGGAGIDTLLGGLGNDDLYGGSGNDSLDGGDGADRLRGDSGDDNLQGGSGDDFLYGYDGNDTLDGGDGNDLLQGMDGNDRLLGGAGNDNLSGGAGNDSLLAGDGDDYLDGGNGNDWLTGMAGNDVLFGGDGNDIMLGGVGDDVLYGLAGNDTMLGGSGNDHLEGGRDQDTVFGGSGNDFLAGNEGNDILNGEDGDDRLIGMAETDYLMGGAGNDQLLVESGQHVLVGGEGDDILAGSTGADVLIGGNGKDSLYGWGGDDLLVGGATSYDNNVAQLRALMAAWSIAAPYADRVSQIADESFNAHLQSNETVIDDHVADEIFGGDGQDWFFLTGIVEIYDPNLSGSTNGATTVALDGGAGHTHPGAVILDHPPQLEGFEFIDSLDRIQDRQADETLQTLIPHVDDPVKEREHLTLTQLVRYDAVTNYAVTSGTWSNPSTWSNGVVPADGAHVLIPIDVKVTVDRVNTARLATIRVDGTLSFSTTANSELRVDTIVVTSLGRYEMGTEAAPIPANVTARLVFTDNGPIDRVADPFALGRGLISHGSVSMFGAATTSYLAVQGAVSAGVNRLTLTSVPTGWHIGDQIVLTSTMPGAEQNEVRRIVGFGTNSIILDRPFTYNHVPTTSDLKVHVANLTRNVIVTSESAAVDRRGHVMFMHSRDVHIQYAGFYQLGRTDKSIPINDSVVDENWQLEPGTGTNPRARYAVHFHRNGIVDDGNPSTVVGCVVVDSPGWGYDNHDSYVDMSNNVAFDVHGAAFVTEDGGEIGSFVNNIAIGTTGSGDATEARQNIQDFGHQGDGFWLQGPGLTVTGNISAGNEGSAYFLFARGVIDGGTRDTFLAANLPDPSIANGAAEVAIDTVPMRDFSNNIGYASAIGLSVWYHLVAASQGQKGVFADSTFWNNSTGVDLPYTKHTILRNLEIVRTPDGEPGVSSGIGVNTNLVTSDVVFENLIVTGHRFGVLLPRQGMTVVNGGVYDNHDDFFVQTAVNADRLVMLTGDIQMNRLAMVPYFTYPAYNSTFMFLQDRVILNFGQFQNQRAYYGIQSPQAIPFPQSVPGVPAAYVGLTSQQLWDQFRVAIGGTLAPDEAISDPSIYGLVGPAA